MTTSIGEIAAGLFFGILILMAGVMLSVVLQQQDTMTIKIMRGDLPECETTIGTPTGYYCSIDGSAYYCKVDPMHIDPYVKDHPWCDAVYFS